MDNTIKLDANKSFEIMNEVVTKINTINNDINILKEHLDINAINEMWISENAEIFSTKAKKVMEMIDFNCRAMEQNILLLIGTIENYTGTDKEVSKNFE